MGTGLFNETTAASGVDVYDVSFECPSLPFDWLDTEVEPPAVTGSGALTDLSGQFPCFMTRFVAD